MTGAYHSICGDNMCENLVLGQAQGLARERDGGHYNAEYGYADT